MSSELHAQDFLKHDSLNLFRSLSASPKLIHLWSDNFTTMYKLLLSPMVQGMLDNSLTREKFDNLYMRPDVLYIYNLGVALAKRAKRENREDEANIMMVAEMFMGYETHHQRFAKYGLNYNDTLNDTHSVEHTILLSDRTNIHEYYVAILTDMMPYVCFANYLFNTVDTDDNIWMAYAKKYGSPDSDYVSNKLCKSIQWANKVLDSNVVTYNRAAELFHEGLTFELYFIEEAMKGNLLKKIQQHASSRGVA